MSTRACAGIGVLATAVALGVLGDLLLRGAPWGLGAFIWFALLLTGSAVLARRYRTVGAAIGWMLLPALLSSFLVWRDSPSLRALNILGVLAALTWVALPIVGVNLKKSGVLTYLVNSVGTWINAAFGALRVALVDEDSRDETVRGFFRLPKAVIRGVFVAIPLALVFCALLMSADPVFENVIRSAVVWDYSTAGSHAFLSAILAWLSAGYLWGFVSGEHPLKNISMAAKPLSLGIVEVGIVLGTLVILFLIFVVVQFAYLFGGEEMIFATAGLSYAEYARRGFFELVAVAALVIPVLMVANAVLSERDGRDRQSFRSLSTVILILVALIMASAFQRMLLYTDAYGLTHDRLYVCVFLGWVGTVLGLFAGTVLFGSGRHFVMAASLSGFAFLSVLNVVNPDALVVRVNLARAEAGNPVDLRHLSSLSDDALPLILERMFVLSWQDRCDLLTFLAVRQMDRPTGWKSWNFGRHRAVSAWRNPSYESNCTDLTPLPKSLPGRYCLAKSERTMP